MLLGKLNCEAVHDKSTPRLLNRYEDRQRICQVLFFSVQKRRNRKASGSVSRSFNLAPKVILPLESIDQSQSHIGCLRDLTLTYHLMVIPAPRYQTCNVRSLIGCVEVETSDSSEFSSVDVKPDDLLTVVES